MPKISRRAAIALLAAPAIAKARPTVAITMDDVNWKGIPQPYLASADDRLLSGLKGKQAALFAVGRNVDNDEGRKILARWKAAGHLLGNHTYSHFPLSDDFQKFEADIARNEQAMPELGKYFRFPLLKEGKSPEARDHVRAFLTGRGFSNGAVTIDASDWYFSERLVTRLKEDSDFDVNRYRDPYLAHLWDRAVYYDGLSQQCLGRSVPHTILIHYNLLNVLFLADVLQMFEKRGWGINGAQEAFADPLFQRHPKTAPAGESLIWALAKESGKFESKLRYPGEDGDYEKPGLDRLGL